MSKSPKTWVQYDNTLPYIEDRDPTKEPSSYLVKDGENSYKVVEERRPSKMLLVNKLRVGIDKWRNNDYPGVTETTRELLNFWFYNDHNVNGEPFNFWFCQKEAIETLIYLYEVKKFNDLKPVVEEYSENFNKGLFKKAAEITKDLNGRRSIVRYFPELKQEGEQDFPEEDLLRYAFKMATGSGKTYTMALAIVWSYFNRLREKSERFPDNFLIVAPNIIVYQRLESDFKSKNNIFYRLPLIPPSWKVHFNLKVTLRKDDSPLNPSGNLIVNNIQQLYEPRKNEESPKNIVEGILGKKPQKGLAKSAVTLIDKIKQLDNLMVINDEAHHVHDEELEWNKTLMSIHKALPDGINLWLDFSATPKFQKTGSYFPWIVVDYPLAQAVEDRIVKSPLIVHRVDKKDPEDITSDNIIQKYGDWITASLERWKEHFKTYSPIGRKPVLFIMAEKNNYADKITEAIRKRKDLGIKNPEDEVVVIHVESTINEKTETEIRTSEKDLDKLRDLVRKIDEPDNKVKIIVSNMMLREGWDVQNVTIILGLRPFTSKAQILPEQAIGRGLRLMKNISPDHTQTLEVMGTKAFEDFVKELEKEGVGINVTKNPPPLPVKIAPEKSRLGYDIEIPRTDFSYVRNYKNIGSINPLEIPSLYSSDKLYKERKIFLRMEFPITETEIHWVEIELTVLPAGREMVSHITKEVMKRARLTCDFNILYPIVEDYILLKCFEVEIKDVEEERLRKHLHDISVEEAIIDLLAKEVGKVSAEKKEDVFKRDSLKLSGIEPFTWRRKHPRCKKTVFNFVATYNDFEEKFAEFLDKCDDIEKFAALAGKFSIDYLSSRGAIRFYWPDFVAVQKDAGGYINWIIETKGREYEDTDRKDEAITRFCETVSAQSDEIWIYQRIMQTDFEAYIKTKVGKPVSFAELLKFISDKNASTNKLGM